MNKSNPWVFAMLFIVAFAYIAWNGFQLPRFIAGESNFTTGKIVATFHKWGPGGESQQRIRYAYSVNDSVYFDFKTIGKHDGWQEVGNRVRIKYAVHHPERNKIENFYSDYPDSFETKFHTDEPIGFRELALTNGIYSYTHYGQQGKILTEDLGEYKLQQDSLFLNSFSNQPPRCLILEGSGPEESLTDTENRRVFRR